MRWLLYGNINPAVSEALVRHGHVTKTPADIGLEPGVSPADILHAAHRNQLDVLTPDPAVANGVFAEPFGFDRCIVFLQLAGGDVEVDDAIDRLFARYKRLTPGRLYTVTETRVKVRQLPSR